MFNFFAMSTPMDATVLLSYIKKISDNKEKSKGNCICEICHLMISKSNKSRHHKSKIHLQNLEKIIGKCQIIVDSYQEGETDKEN